MLRTEAALDSSLELALPIFAPEVHKPSLALLVLVR